MAHYASFPIDDDLFAPCVVLGELGSRPLPVYVGRVSAAPTAGGPLVVAERFAGAGRSSHPAEGDLRREARRLSTLANPHLARIREVAVRGDDLIVFGDFIDGEKIAQFWPSADPAAPRPFGSLPLEIALRILLDVLAAASALHGLRDTAQQPMKLTHGEISPATVLFGSDGVGRVLHAVARRATGVQAEAASLPYLAPEVHAGDPQDARTDVFSVGVLLWEALEGRSLSLAVGEVAGLRVRSGELPAPKVPEGTPWAKGLAPVVTKALACAPEDRWATAAAMAAEIRKGAGLKLAAASAAAAFAKNKFGEHTKKRRARWESASRSSRPEAAIPGLGLVFRVPPDSVSVGEMPDERSFASSFIASVTPAPSSALAPASPLAGASTDRSASALAALNSLPRVRDEEISSSILESYRPPPAPTPAPALASAATPAFGSAAAPALVSAATLAFAPALLSSEPASALVSSSPASSPSGWPSDVEPPTVPARYPALTARVEEPLPHEAPIVFDETKGASPPAAIPVDAASVTSALSALSVDAEPASSGPSEVSVSASEPPLVHPRRKRWVAAAGAAAVVVAVLGGVAIRGAGRSTSVATDTPSSQAATGPAAGMAAAVGPVPTVVDPNASVGAVASGAGLAPGANSAVPSTGAALSGSAMPSGIAAPPASASATPITAAHPSAGGSRAKGASKAKGAAGGPSHTKSGTVRPAAKSKPGTKPVSS